jgi:hypothetical protein
VDNIAPFGESKDMARAPIECRRQPHKPTDASTGVGVIIDGDKCNLRGIRNCTIENFTVENETFRYRAVTADALKAYIGYYVFDRVNKQFGESSGQTFRLTVPNMFQERELAI